MSVFVFYRSEIKPNVLYSLFEYLRVLNDVIFMCGYFFAMSVRVKTIIILLFKYFIK